MSIFLVENVLGLFAENIKSVGIHSKPITTSIVLRQLVESQLIYCLGFWSFCFEQRSFVEVRRMLQLIYKTFGRKSIASHSES